MNAIARTSFVAGTARGRAAFETAPRYVVKVGETTCAVRAHAVAAIADVLGFEQEMEAAAEDPLAGGGDSVIVDLLDSRMIAPPRPLRRRQRPVSSRAVFYGVGG